MRFSILLVAATAALPMMVTASAFAEPLLTKSEIAAAARKIDACLAKENDASKCTGLIQNACDDAISAGGDLAHVTCADNETAAWDVLLNEAWDALPQAIGPAHFAELKKVQKTWLTYRDAKCGFLKSSEAFSWGLMLAAQCKLDETSRRVGELRDLLSDPNFATP